MLNLSCLFANGNVEPGGRHTSLRKREDAGWRYKVGHLQHKDVILSLDDQMRSLGEVGVIS